MGPPGAPDPPPPQPAPYLVSSETFTSAGAVMGALECPAVGSSAFSSPLVEFSAWWGGARVTRLPHTPRGRGASPGPHLVFAVWLDFIPGLRLRGQVGVDRADGRRLQGMDMALRPGCHSALRARGSTCAERGPPASYEGPPLHKPQLWWYRGPPCAGGPLPNEPQPRGQGRPGASRVPGASRPSRSRSRTRSRCGPGGR